MLASIAGIGSHACNIPQGRPSIAAVKRSPEDDHHAFLAFSFEVSNSTEVLSIDGTHFRPVSLPGLVTDEASKLVTSAAGGWLVQATLRVCQMTLLLVNVVWRLYTLEATSGKLLHSSTGSSCRLCTCAMVM